ncbi:hypothetical protein [Photobacterium damselae]|uniref:hypothetical protein n=1 Tax=Photobacterium damselae TaxID=38293 RepID=UPI000E03D00E|nr:hypothetical protein [Photobacterium damselae]SUB90134.1 Uncharacterised protein [Photobacterium damselae]
MGIANDKYAAITRQMFDDWEKRFLPKQLELLQKASSGELATEQIQRVDDNMKSSLRAATQSNANAQARFGVESSVADNSDLARQALGLAGAKNAIRDHERDRSLGVLSGAGVGLREKMNIGGGV